MKSLSLALPAALILLAACPKPALTQQNFTNGVLIPSSSIRRPEDRGVRFHTHYLVRDPKFFGALSITPSTGKGPQGGMTPGQIRSFYSMPVTGGSHAIAIVDAYHDDFALHDFNLFARKFNLPHETSTNPTAFTNQVFQVVYASGSKPPVDAGWAGEEALDVEWAHAMAPNTKIYLVEADSNSYSDLIAAIDKAVSLPDVREVSMSWGGSEDSSELQSESCFPTGKGIVFFAASGDNGAGVEWPSVSPNVVAVGGTSIATTLKGVFKSETGWSGSGGGVSAYEPKPTYQNGIVNTDPSFRSVPDVSIDADPFTGVSMYDTYGGGWYVVGGTSVSTPCLAGMVNLAGHFYADSPTELTTIYADSRIFRDILKGSNGQYRCLPGYDLVTGVGAPQGTTGL